MFARPLPTPLLVLSPAVARRNVVALRAALPGVELFYAVKCQPHPAMLAALAADDIGFEVASPAELRAVPPGRVRCLHPVKSAAFVRELAGTGVRTLAVD